MPFNKFLTAMGAAGLGLTMATSAMATVYSAAPANITDIGLGFGKFLGTWKRNAGSDPMPNVLQSGSANVAQVGAAILAKTDPDPFAPENFGFLNKEENFFGGPEKRTVKWEYGDLDLLTLPPPGSGLAPVGLFFALKYSTFISVFQFSLVDHDGDGKFSVDSNNDGVFDSSDVEATFGYISTDAEVIVSKTSQYRPGSLAALNYEDLDNCPVTTYSTTCIPDHAISHVGAYGAPIEVPEPAAVGLMGLGLAGLLSMVWRRKARAA